MRVLALDTATPDLVTGVVDLESGQVTEQVIEDTRLLSEQLMPAVEGVIDKLDRGYADIDAFAVGVGPGPFSGLRVGMATASALGQAVGKPVHGVCTHDAIAFELAKNFSGPATALVATDARRKEIYFAFYRLDNGAAVRLGEPDVVRPEELVIPEELPVQEVDLVSIPPHLLERLPEVFHAAEVVNQRPTAAGLVGMAQAAVVDVAEGLATTPQPLVPLYLRRPDAKEPAAKPRSAAIPEVEL